VIEGGRVQLRSVEERDHRVAIAASRSTPGYRSIVSRAAASSIVS
jgi:hypothetical protein